MVPDCIAALVGVARWMPDDVCLGAQFVRSLDRRVQYNSRRSPHDFLHQRDVDDGVRTYDGTLSGHWPDRFLRAVQKELEEVERREREFNKTDRKERAAKVGIPIGGGKVAHEAA